MRPVTVVVVNYRTPKLLDELLGALLHRVSTELPIIVVDNASNDESADMVESNYPTVTLVRSPVNLGFARAVNLALESVSDSDVLLLNPDCLPQPEAFDILRAHLVAEPKCGIAAPLITHPTRSLGALAAGAQPTTRALICHYLGFAALFPDREWASGWHLRLAHHSDSPRRVGWASGACLLIRKEALDAVGGRLSERWFMYGEDMDLCRRVWNAGMEVHHVPSARVTHIIGASTNDSLNDRWVSVLLDYNKTFLSETRLSHETGRVAVAVGLLVRSVVNGLRALTSRTELRREYLREAKKSLYWSKRAWLPERTNLDRPFG